MLGFQPVSAAVDYGNDYFIKRIKNASDNT